MQRKTFGGGLCCFLSIFAGVLAAFPKDLEAEWFVWTTTRAVRAMRDATPQTKLAVSVSAARNEWVSFQIMLRADTPIDGVTLVPGQLQSAGGEAISWENVRLYRQHQLEITQSSSGRGQSLPFVPGWYSDALIPFTHPLTREALPPAGIRAVPFSLPANETHAFWVDLYVPAGTPPGTYSAVFSVQAGQAVLEQVPVSLEVWNFTLPKFSTMKTDFGTTLNQLFENYPRISGRASSEIDWTATTDQTRELLMRHRINSEMPRVLTEPAEVVSGKPRFADWQVSFLQAYIDAYNLNAVRIGSPTPHEVVGEVNKMEVPTEAISDALVAVDDMIRRVDRPQTDFYLYLMDEPNSAETYEFIRNWGGAVRDLRSADSRLQVLVTEQPTTQDPDWGTLHGAVDIWCPGYPQFNPNAIQQRQAAGESAWIYTALNWWQTDYPLMNYRASAWVAWYFGVRGQLYWEIAHWDEVDDPWTEPVTYSTESGVYNGEGNLVYPGHRVGFEGVVPSVRLKVIRDAIEDYEYLTILEQQGAGALARQVVSVLVTDYDPQFGPFLRHDEDSVLFDLYRDYLARRIGPSQ